MGPAAGFRPNNEPQRAISTANPRQLPGLSESIARNWIENSRSEDRAGQQFFSLAMMRQMCTKIRYQPERASCIGGNAAAPAKGNRDAM
jgi:hypothetical protein